ncbi:hypothetical protein [Nitrosovibrio sp. Nv4]|uniref:hypothetical protein n=1 Tax=Nitrosovibrio sp. Nv4 TaxID=1945880 RepID=UPI001358C739|nr:hypothetical protein [Nitrosovibrio sp. Nv4]
MISPQLPLPSPQQGMLIGLTLTIFIPELSSAGIADAHFHPIQQHGKIGGQVLPGVPPL